MHKSIRLLPALIVLLPASQGLLAEQVCKYGSIPASAPATRFIDNNNGTLTDTATGLQWKRCSEGQTWNGSTCIGAAALYTWPEALQSVAGPAGSYAGSNDWRLPNVKELSSILEDACVEPAIDAAAFPATPANWFWASTPYAGLEGGIWGVDFYDGFDGFDLDFTDSYVRLVRGG
ncbi:MAG: DUF1566 domain-containing protein [Thiohalocapsa sp.]|jgi:hypothetical protein|nr:DUF1566 domain-containing protein [Thiohalocapsa sp.]